MRVVIEAMEPHSSGSLFSVSVNERLVADLLTAAQAHLLTGEALELFAMPGRSRRRNSYASLDDDVQAARGYREPNRAI